MAEPRRQQQNQPPARDRRSDMETLAASIFVHRYIAAMATREPSSLARECLKAAREFYLACDEPTPTEKG